MNLLLDVAEYPVCKKAYEKVLEVYDKIVIDLEKMPIATLLQNEKIGEFMVTLFIFRFININIEVEKKNTFDV